MRRGRLGACEAAKPPTVAAAQKQPEKLQGFAGFAASSAAARGRGGAQMSAAHTTQARYFAIVRRGKCGGGDALGAVFDQSLKSKLKRSALFKLSRNALFIIVKISKTVF